MSNQDFVNNWVKAQKDLVNNWKNLFTVEKEAEKEPNYSEAFLKGVNQLVDAQKQVAEVWKNAYKVEPQFFGTSFSDVKKVQQDFVTRWQELVGKLPNGDQLLKFSDFNQNLEQLKKWINPQGFNQFAQFGKLIDKDVYQTLAKVYDANGVYNKFYEYYEQLKASTLNPLHENFTKQYQEATKVSKEAYDKFVSPFIPKEVLSLLETPKQVLDNLVKSNNELLAPWKSSLETLVHLYNQGVTGDLTKLSEFFAIWKDNYDQTIGAIINSPALGSQGEVLELQNKYVDKVINLLRVSVELQTKVTTISQNRVKELQKEFVAALESGKEVPTFKEFYNYWSNEIEKTLNGYFYTDEFSSVLAEFADSYAQLKIYQDKVIESYLKDTPIVLDSDVKSVYKNVYELKKEVKALRKELDALKEVKASSKPSTKAEAAPTVEQEAAPKKVTPKKEA